VARLNSYNLLNWNEQLDYKYHNLARPIKHSTFCAAHEKIFQRANSHWEALITVNGFMIKKNSHVGSCKVGKKVPAWPEFYVIKIKMTYETVKVHKDKN